MIRPSKTFCLTKPFAFFLLFLLFSYVIAAQKAFIHSHNDYGQTEPLVNALRHRVFSLEADIYLVNDTLKVAHDKKGLATAPSLNSLYIQPIVSLFQAHNGRISSDNQYAPVLMIDIKENGEAVLSALETLLSGYPGVFDRNVNRKAVQVVISGDRGAIFKWTSRPSYILFDGRIHEQYNEKQLERVAFISDSYLNYSKHKDSTDILITQLGQKADQMKKLLRLWAIPDNPSSWTRLIKLGVDIINTDKVTECRRYVEARW